MPRLIIARFIRAFAKGLLGQLADKIADVCFVVGPILVVFGKNGFSPKKVIAAQWESVTIGIVGLSCLIIWHAVRSAFTVAGEVKEENQVYGFNPSQERLRFAKIKLTAIVLMLTWPLLGFCYLSWARIPKAAAPIETAKTASSPEKATDLTGIQHSLDEINEKLKQQGRPSIPPLQMEMLRTVADFFRGDENALREEFTYPSILSANVNMVKACWLDFRKTKDKSTFNVFPYLTGETLIHGPLGSGGVKRYGGSVMFSLDPEDIRILVLSKQYTARKNDLKSLIHSPELPGFVVKKVQKFDETIQANSDSLLDVIHDMAREDPDYFIRYDDISSPAYFRQIDSRWYAKFIQLRPVADGVVDSLREFINSR